MQVSEVTQVEVFKQYQRYTMSKQTAVPILLIMIRELLLLLLLLLQLISKWYFMQQRWSHF